MSSPTAPATFVERRQRMRRRERRRRDQEARRDAVGIGAEGHVRDVQEPARPQVAGIELAGRARARRSRVSIPRGACARPAPLIGSRQESRLWPRTQFCSSPQRISVVACSISRSTSARTAWSGAEPRDLLQQIVDLGDAVGVAPGEEQLLGQRRPRREEVRRVGRRAGDRGGDGLGTAVVDVEPEIARRRRRPRGPPAARPSRACRGSARRAPAPSASRRRRARWRPRPTPPGASRQAPSP